MSEDRVVTIDVIQETLHKVRTIIDQTRLIEDGFANYIFTCLTIDDEFLNYPLHGWMPKKYRNGKELIVSRKQIYETLKEIIPAPFTWNLEYREKSHDYIMKIQIVTEPRLKISGTF